MSFVKGPRALSVMQTYTCPAACEHCGTYSSPDNRTTLPVERVLRTIDEAKQLGFAPVVFTGGETTLRWKDLLTAIAHATALGLPTRVVTNAHWARSLDEAHRRIAELVAAGLYEINFSTGDEHARFVPVEQVVFACVASIQAGLPVHVMIEHRKKRLIDVADILKHPLIEMLSDEQRKRLVVKPSPWMPLDPTVKGMYDDGMTVDRSNLAIRTGCDNVLSTYTLKADGTIAACCGIGMFDIRELTVTNAEGSLATAVERAEDDFMKVWLHYVGPEKILAWAASKDPSIEWEGWYSHHCQSCHRIYKDPRVRECIREHYREVIGEVMQAAWLDEGPLREAVTVR